MANVYIKLTTYSGSPATGLAWHLPLKPPPRGRVGPKPQWEDQQQATLPLAHLHIFLHIPPWPKA